MGVYSTGFGMIAYSVVYFAVLLLLLRFPFQFNGQDNGTPFGVPAKKFGYLAAPLVLGLLFSQMSQWVDIRFGSQLGDGIIAALSFSKKLIDVPVLILASSIGIVLLPYLTQYHSQGRTTEFVGLVRRSLLVCMLVYGIAAVVYLFFSDLIVALVYSRGKFGADSVSLTGRLLVWYTPGLLVFALEIIVMQAMYAVKAHWVATGMGMACAAANVALTIVLVPKFGAIAIPALLVGQKLVKTTILYIILQRKLAAFAAPIPAVAAA